MKSTDTKTGMVVVQRVNSTQGSVEVPWERAMRRRDACIERYGRDAFGEAARTVVADKVAKDVEEQSDEYMRMTIVKHAGRQGALAYLALHGTSEMILLVCERCEDYES